MSNRWLRKKSRGFTLLEVSTAVFILVMAFGGTIALIMLGQESKVGSRNDMIAAYLAKEGVALVRFIRDENYYNSQPAFTDIYNETDPYHFIIDYRGRSSLAVASSSEARNAEALKLVDSYYAYSNDGSIPATPFRRLITTTYHSSATPPYLDVKVDVYWQEGTKRNTVTVADQLTDWH